MKIYRLAGGLTLLVGIAAFGVAFSGAPNAYSDQPSGAPALHLTHTSVSHVAENLNVAFLQQRTLRYPRKCGPQDLGNGVWVRVDCHLQQPIKAPLLFGARKSTMAASGKLQIRPGAFGRLANLKGVTPAKGGAPPTKASGEPSTKGSASQSSESEMPDVVDHRTNHLEGPVWNQGMVGSCTAVSLGNAYNNALRRANINDDVSPLHIWSLYGKPSMVAAIDGVKGNAVCLWGTWEYKGPTACQISDDNEDECGGAYNVTPNSAKTDPKVVQQFKAANQAGKYKLISVERLDNPIKPDEVAAVLATGQDLWVAFKLDMDKWTGRAHVDHVIQDWAGFSGGHAVVLAGMRKTTSGKRQFLIHNSWGQGWGDGGYAWVNEAMLPKWMYYAYKIKLEGAAPSTKDLTDADCAWDELIDAGSHQCAKMCDSDENPRPTNGQCADGGGDDGGDTNSTAGGHKKPHGKNHPPKKPKPH